MSLIYGDTYRFFVTYAGKTEYMISSGVKRKLLTSRNVENGYYLYPNAWSFTYSHISKQTEIDRDRYDENDFLDDNNYYDEYGQIIGQYPDQNTNINGNYGNINVGLDGLITGGNFDLVAGMGNIGNTMTGFFGMMAGFFSFLPAVIWTLLGVLITICIALRILGR